MKGRTNPLPSIHPSTEIRLIDEYLQRIALITVFILGGGTLAYWLIGPLAHVLPPIFAMMRPNTPLLICLCASSCSLSMPQSSSRSVVAARAVAGFAAGLAGLILLKNWGLVNVNIEGLLARDLQSLHAKKVSTEAALMFVLLRLILANIRARKNLLSHAVDGLT